MLEVQELDDTWVIEDLEASVFSLEICDRFVDVRSIAVVDNLRRDFLAIFANHSHDTALATTPYLVGEGNSAVKFFDLESEELDDFHFVSSSIPYTQL